ncbi:uncharacterized protein CC84DRAFT_1165911 [Paraphaeosphaeria sporulosa]|uniref:Uncharacterized protein n=1 Tax=Paraphaeosphaeria sporulosa TaxID=1460663 RepID=A0A177C845_9PLEO|nr:uncharacterized protein CC84DRAFT_1165911 [Paraphaeosphaeria sporulosa]OAG03725.1 hypothetical protein CC84DRAFT_1165911 [Paraphaeosphaeria sporulosa]
MLRTPIRKAWPLVETRAFAAWLACVGWANTPGLGPLSRCGKLRRQCPKLGRSLLMALPGSSKTTPGWARRVVDTRCPRQPAPSGTIKEADYWQPVARMTGCVLEEEKASDPGLWAI